MMSAVAATPLGGPGLVIGDTPRARIRRDHENIMGELGRGLGVNRGSDVAGTAASSPAPPLDHTSWEAIMRWLSDGAGPGGVLIEEPEVYRKDGDFGMDTETVTVVTSVGTRRLPLRFTPWSRKCEGRRKMLHGTKVDELAAGRGHPQIFDELYAIYASVGGIVPRERVLAHETPVMEELRKDAEAAEKNAADPGVMHQAGLMAKAKDLFRARAGGHPEFRRYDPARVSLGGGRRSPRSLDAHEERVRVRPPRRQKPDPPPAQDAPLCPPWAGYLLLAALAVGACVLVFRKRA